MSKTWPKVRLGEVLKRSDETVEPLADAEYREITVRLWGKGVVERGVVVGASLSGRRFIAHAGQFIASRIDARNGAMGLVPPILEGALVTNDFPLFWLNCDRLEPSFLGWLCRTNGFVELCQRASKGTTNRVRLKEERFLALEILLPPLSEQRRIVARIEELAAQINEARTLRQQAEGEIEAALVNQVGQIISQLEERYKPCEFGSFSPHVTSGPRNWAKRYENSGFRFYRAQVSKATMTRRLNKLMASGWVKIHGRGRSTFYTLDYAPWRQ